MPDAAKRDEFWASIRRTAAELEHQLNLKGKQLAKCTACDGTGHREPGRSDYDAHRALQIELDANTSLVGAVDALQASVGAADKETP